MSAIEKIEEGEICPKEYIKSPKKEIFYIFKIQFGKKKGSIL